MERFSGMLMFTDEGVGLLAGGVDLEDGFLGRGGLKAKRHIVLSAAGSTVPLLAGMIEEKDREVI
jgi:hypothetical protein